MNDPLRDNRIFPEEMHEKPQSTPEKKPMNLTWLWTLLLILGILLLVWFGYRHYQKQKLAHPVNNNVVIPTPQQQVESFNSLQQASPKLAPEEREQAIDVLFGGSN